MDDYAAHEALDRLHIVVCMLDDHLLHHPYIMDRPALLRLVGKASELLVDAYQTVGAEHLPKP